jgi:flagellum-specific ATP synthase
VLAEGDDQQDPIIDSSRAILDGHLVLTRELAAQGHFPAIDILQSVSRLMPQLVSKGHYEAAIDLRRTYSAYEQNKDLISVGAYQRGTDPDVDQALRQLPFIKDFLRQDMRSSVDIAESIRQLQSLPEEFDDRPSKSFTLDRSRDEEVLDG